MDRLGTTNTNHDAYLRQLRNKTIPEGISWTTRCMRQDKSGMRIDWAKLGGFHSKTTRSASERAIFKNLRPGRFSKRHPAGFLGVCHFILRFPSLYVVLDLTFHEAVTFFYAFLIHKIFVFIFALLAYFRQDRKSVV